MSTRSSLAANATRIVWGVLALVLLAALLASVFLSRGSIDDAEAAAQARAVDWANTVLFDALTPEEVQAPILGPDYRELLITVQAGIRSDDRTARVRIWNADGVLVFSDDQRDKIGDFVATDNPQIEAALSGTTVSVPTQATVAPKSGLAGSDEKLFQTFVPLRLENALGISGVAQIDQRYAAVEAEATDVWQKARLALVIALTIAVAGLLFSFRARPAPVAVEGGEAAAPSRSDRRQLERVAKTEEQLRLMTERAEAAETTSAETEASVAQAVARLRELESRATQAEERATQAEERAERAESALQGSAERPSGGEGLHRGVPGMRTVAVSAGGSELEAKLNAAEAERVRLTGEVGRLRAALGEREAELAVAKEGASAGAELEEARGLALEHERRAGELGQVVAEHEQRAAAFEERLTGLGQEAATARERVAELETLLEAAQAAAAAPEAAERPGKAKDGKKAASDLRAAQLQANDLQMQLTEMQGALDEAKGAVAEKDRLSTELEAARAELAKADTELTAVRGALAAKDAEATAATSAVVERTAALEAVLGEMESAVVEIEARATAAETRATKAEITRAELAAELNRVRAETSKARVSAGDDDLESLRQQVAELESARRNDIVELQRAQESLANTQSEGIQARRRVKELEEQLQRALSASADASPTAAPAADEPPPSYASRLAHLVSERDPSTEPARPTPTPTPTPTPAESAPGEEEEADESALSLRERLTRAAAARHRMPGAPGSDT
jgi:chromosome segregation ATPase